jgi:hypothetical protein
LLLDFRAGFFFFAMSSPFVALLEMLSFAKTGAALLSVTIPNVSGVDRTNDRDAWQAWRARWHVSCILTCTAQPTPSRQAARRS